MKKAISLIELLLAIIVVGIGASAIPYIAVVTTKANEQTILSEVVTSTRIMVDELLLEPYNSVLADGFTGGNGATLYTGIVKAVNCNDDASCDSLDRRLNKTATQYFSRSLAVQRDGTFVKASDSSRQSGDANVPGSANYKPGLNYRLDPVLRTIETNEGDTSKKKKNLIKFSSKAGAKFLNINANGTQDLNVTFQLDSTKNTADNAMVIDVNSTMDDNATIGGVSAIVLYGFAFNIGEESK